MNGDRCRLSIDVGGTFTDVVLEKETHRWTTKVLTTPTRPEQGVLTGIRDILAIAGLALADVDTFIHGTTLATNAIIERKGARVALLTTQGFRDVLDIAAETRYDQYELSPQKPRQLVERDLRFTVPERMDAAGGVRLALDEARLVQLAGELRARDIESLAIVFLHAFRNPAHEQRAAAVLRSHLPDLSISLSSEVCPEIREYERTSTTVANAYVQPLIAGYLGRLILALEQAGFRGVLRLMTSGGGLTAVETAQRFPVRLVESGPAGGAIFAGQVAARAQERKVIAFDMGGTTAKISLIHDYKPASGRLFEVDRAARFLKGSGLPLRIPVIEMVEIGAGGGSLAHVDALQRVTVGPESAASEPGPACYDRGGRLPAVTDADLALGLISPDGFAGGSIALKPELSRAALGTAVAQRLGITPEMAAHAVYEVVCENMASAARVHTVERGAIASQYTIVASGGAAPLHVARVAEKIGVKRIIIPPNAGVGSAVGFLAAPVSFELVRSFHCQLDAFDVRSVDALLGDMSAEVRALVAPAAHGAVVSERRTAFARYVGQGHEIQIDVPAGGFDAETPHALREAFEQAYGQLFHRTLPRSLIEILAWSVAVTTPPPQVEPTPPVTIVPAGAPDRQLRFYDGAVNEFLDIPRYQRDALAAGMSLQGPAVIIEAETSTYVPASFDAHIDAAGCIVLDARE